MNSNYWLDLAQDLLKTKSDAELARRLGTSRQTICMIKAGTHGLSAKMGIVIADLLRIHPMLVLTSIMHDQARSDADRSFWKTQYWKYANSCQACDKWFAPPTVERRLEARPPLIQDQKST